MRLFDVGIITIIIVKIIFIILAVTKVYVKHKEPNNKKKIHNLEFWKKRVEFIFIALMSVLLIYLFNPRVNRINMIDYETKILLFLFGFILLLTADWNQFLQHSKIKLFKDIQNVLGNQ
jgi:uncharacterized membrane protein YiaA